MMPRSSLQLPLWLVAAGLWVNVLLTLGLEYMKFVLILIGASK
jgi:hypothetical protein